MKRILLLSFTFSFVFVLGALAQRTVSGNVTDDNGETVPGINVVLKGTTTGTTTDLDGNYRVSVPEDGGTLVFSFIGLATQEVEIGARSVIDLAMAADVQQLTEVVVTAVGIKREQRALGSAVTTLGSEQIARKSEADVLRSMQGKVPGVNISAAGAVAGSSTNITIRGNSSLTGNNQPLFVVDGVPFNNDVNASTSFTGGNQYSNRAIDLDPNIIESYTVLKGAAATALYGSRAANGVIVITTKGGSGSGIKKGLEVSFSSSYNVEQLAGVPDYTDKYGQGGSQAFNRGFVGNWGPSFSSLDSIDHPYAGGFAADIFPEFEDTKVAYEPHNNFEDFHRTGFLFENSITVANGFENGAISGTVSHANNEGIIPNSSFERTAVNVGFNTTLSNNFFLRTNLNYVKSRQITPQVSPGNGGGSSVYTRLILTPVSIDLKSLPFQDPVTGGGVYYRDDQDNPYWAAENTGYESDVDRVFGNFTFGYNFTDWLSVSYQVGVNQYTDRRLSYTRKGSLEDPLGSMSTDHFAFEELDGVLLLNANKDLSEDLSLSVNVGHNINQRTLERVATNGVQFIAFEEIALNNTVTQTAFEDFTRYRFHAVFLDATLGFRDYLFVNAVMRNDWSSTLPASNQSYLYYGANASLVFTDAFNIQSDVLSFGKVRVGWTRVGNEADPYQTQTTFLTNNDANGGIGNSVDLEFPFTATDGTIYNLQASNNVLGNPNLTPEFTTEFEVGLEAYLFNRFRIDATYYNRASSDQIVTSDIAPSTGYLQTVTNVGLVRNEGFELGLDFDLLPSSSDFQWNIYSAFTRNRNTVEELSEDLQNITVGGFSNLGIVHREGLEYGQILGIPLLKADNGQPLIDPSTGGYVVPDNEDIIGNPNPDFLLGVTNTFSYKGVSLGLLFDWRKGGDIFSQSAFQTLSRGVLSTNDEQRELPIILDGVLGNPDGSPILDDGGNLIQNAQAMSVNAAYFIDGGYIFIDELHVYDASYIKLREITLSYSLPKAILSNTPFGSVNIGFSGRNLWWNTYNMPDALNFDPEVSAVGAGNAQGLEFLNAPTTRRYGANISFTF